MSLQQRSVNDEEFKPHSLTIGELLGNLDAFYQIPRYQRPYSWGDEQLDKLWDDLKEALEAGSHYFLGSVITAKPKEASNYLDIVDGQQRMTTLVILLCVCRDLYPQINQALLDEDPFAVDANLIKTSILANGRNERLRLRTHSQHSSDFHDLVLKDGKAVGHSRPYKRELKIAEAPQFKFRNTAAFFEEKLSEMGEANTGVFINFLFKKVKIIRIDCQSVGFAIKLFQVLNDRGLDLSNSDLIKSYLIGRIHLLHSQDAEYSQKLEDQFMDDWKLCENIAQDTNETMNNLLVLFEYYLLGSNPERSLYDELVDCFEKLDPNEVLIRFKKFIQLYKKEVYESTNPVIYSLYYTRWSMYWRSIVLTALCEGYKEYDEFLIVFRRYYYLNWIAGNTLSKVKQTSFNIIGWLKEGRAIKDIKADLEVILQKDVLLRAKDRLDGDIYYEAWCKPLLYMIEYNHQDKPVFHPMENRYVHTEHILPVKYADVDDWAFAKQIKWLDEWIHSGANLTLLSGEKNISASNAGFDTKISAYDGTGFYEDGDERISSFAITQKVVNDYNAGRYNKEWSVQAMNARWVWFCDQVQKMLDIDLTSIRNKQLPMPGEGDNVALLAS